MAKKLKASRYQYRNIKGIHYEFCSACRDEDMSYASHKEEAKKLGLRFRVIDGQFYREFNVKEKT